ncbi:MAG: hypothetical protein OEY97_07640 [Nitrospirota bacterium]|nr:hypothetical protein [Nitrospirota bacterium]
MNTDFRVSVHYFEHTKTKRLRRALGYEGVVAHLRLMAFAAREKVDGVFRDMEPDEIEEAAGWDGEPGAFFAAVTDKKIGFLEASHSNQWGTAWALHDWAHHNGYAMHASTRSAQARIAASARWKRENASCCQHCGQQCGEQCSMHADSNAPSPSPSPSPFQEKKTSSRSKKSMRFALPEWVPQEAWKGWVEMRQRSRKPLTPRAMGMAVKKLDTLRQVGHDPASVLDQSTLHTWADLYPIKGQQAGGTSERDARFLGGGK